MYCTKMARLLSEQYVWCSPLKQFGMNHPNLNFEKINTKIEGKRNENQLQRLRDNHCNDVGNNFTIVSYAHKDFIVTMLIVQYV